MIHNLSLELIVLPNVLALALHQVYYFGWMDQGDHSWYQTRLIDKLLLEHVGLPHILVLAVNMVNFFSWVSQGGHSEALLLLALIYQSTPSCLNIIG